MSDPMAFGSMEGTSVKFTSPHQASEQQSDLAVSIEYAGSVQEIRVAMANLKERDEVITAKLRSYITSQKQFAREMARLDLLRGQLGTQAIAARSISNNMLADASITAARISTAVQRLDVEQERVKATLQVVEQVAELKACVQGVTGLMEGPQDWETAAGYLHRASKIPEDITKGSFAESMVPSAEIPDPPSVTLENATQSLCGLFLREFERAVKADDGSKVTRFFKLFPLIGRPEVGLNAYGKYVCQGVATYARANLHGGTGGHQRKDAFFFAHALSKLFEYMASIVDRHGGLVERHYGQGRMVKVIQRLQFEADSQGGIIIDTWSDERDIDRKLTDVKSYAFTFQSFLPHPNTRLAGQRTASPASLDRKTEHSHSEVEDPTDMKDIDAVLNEIGVMLGRWSLYSRFIAANCAPPTKDDELDPALSMPEVLETSDLFKKVTEKLISPFNAMSTFYVRRSVERAFQLDEQPPDLTLNLNKKIPSEGPHVTSAVDDVTYIVKQVVQRTVATCQREVIANVIPAISGILNTDFVGMCQRKMRDECYPKPLVQGGFPPEHIIVSFMVMMNDLDIAMDYVGQIVALGIDPSGDSRAIHTVPSQAMLDRYPFNADAVFVTNTLNGLNQKFRGKATELLNEGVRVLFQNVMTPRLTPVVAGAFRDIEYDLTADALDELNRQAEENNEISLAAEDAVSRRFEPGWIALTKPIGRILTDNNYNKLLNSVVASLAKALENRIKAYGGRINSLGAVRMERDVASLVRMICSGKRAYELREYFTRCMQICLCMNMEDDEWEAELEASDIDWKLDAEERIRARGLVQR